MAKGIFSMLVLMVICGLFFGCAQMRGNQKQGTYWGAGIGAGTGAIAGQAIGGNTESTLIGTGIGGIIGSIIGNQFGAYMDEQQAELEELERRSTILLIRRSEDILYATFRGLAMFPDNSAVLSSGAQVEISRVAKVLAKYNRTNVLVAGHTDIRGDERYNQQLSEKRADSVKNVLIREGVDPFRIRTVGYGESSPISDEDAVNRRVELTLIPAE